MTGFYGRGVRFLFFFPMTYLPAMGESYFPHGSFFLSHPQQHTLHFSLNSPSVIKMDGPDLFHPTAATFSFLPPPCSLHPKPLPALRISLESLLSHLTWTSFQPSTRRKLSSSFARFPCPFPLPVRTSPGPYIIPMRMMLNSYSLGDLPLSRCDLGICLNVENSSGVDRLRFGSKDCPLPFGLLSQVASSNPCVLARFPPLTFYSKTLCLTVFWAVFAASFLDEHERSTPFWSASFLFD